MGLLQKIGLAAATLVLLGGTAAAQQFSVRVYSRPRVTRVYRVPTYTYAPPRYYYTYRPGYYTTYPSGYYTTYPSTRYYTYAPAPRNWDGASWSYSWGNHRHHRRHWRR